VDAYERKVDIEPSPCAMHCQTHVRAQCADNTLFCRAWYTYVQNASFKKGDTGLKLTRKQQGKVNSGEIRL
jgi:hypothetical protein